MQYKEDDFLIWERPNTLLNMGNNSSLALVKQHTEE